MHITALMREYGAPMTRDEYLRWTNLGKSAKIAPEEEAELPQRFAYPVISHEELPQKKTGGGKAKRPPVPVDFSGPVFENPNGVEPQLDTDSPAPVKNMGNTKNAPLTKPPMSTQNSKAERMEPDSMVPREQ